MKKLVAIAVASLLSIGLTAASVPTAQAETIKRHGAKKVRILPKGAPAGATVVFARVTVKKGKKTLAFYQPSYKAKKGSYTVTSYIDYRVPTTYTPEPSSFSADCRVTSREITQDRTSWNGYSDGTGYYSGQVSVKYTGSCVEDFDAGDYQQRYTWDASWATDEYVFTDDTTPSADRAALILAELDYVVGDVDYVAGADLSAIPTVTTAGELQSLVKTRKVTVK